MKEVIVGVLCLFFSAYSGAQQQQMANFTHAAIAVEVDAKAESVYGKVIYTFTVSQKLDSVFLDAYNMTFNSVLLDGNTVRYDYNNKTISIRKKLEPGHRYQLTLDFTAHPVQTVYFIGWNDDLPDNEQVWTQGQGKYTSHWLPSFDDMNEKVEFDLTITFDAQYEVIANGRLQGTQLDADRKTWNYDMDQPMSSYLLAFVIGKYRIHTLESKNGTPLQLYSYPGDSSRVEPTYRYTLPIFDYMVDEIGVPYPWKTYKEIPVRDFLYAGMENTGTTIFSDAFMIDSLAFIDKNYVNVNAHEMAHQWFGNLVTEQDGNHHWLHEGFATYYAYLAEKEIFGDEYFYWKLYETAIELENITKKGEGKALTDPNAGSLTFYEKGAWAVHMLKSEIGELAFRKGIISYLNKYAYRNVQVSDFINEMEKACGHDLNDFSKKWLDEPVFPIVEALENLRDGSKGLRDFFELQQDLTTSNMGNEMIIKRYWDKSSSDYFKREVIRTYHKSLSEEFVRSVFLTGDISIRQALLLAMERIPQGLKPQFESLLDDPSYKTIENALYKLWVYFPLDRAQYLDKTKTCMGLPDKNVRILWLILAVITKDYLDSSEKEAYLAELRGYTDKQFPMEVRQNAFMLIHDVLGLSDQNMLDLVSASIHYSWQFRNFARSMLGELLKDAKKRQRMKSLSKELKGAELRYINSKLGIE